MPALKNRSARRRDNSRHDGSAGEKTSYATEAGYELTKPQQLFPHRTSGTIDAILSWIYYLGFLALLATFAFKFHYALPKPVVEGRNPTTGELQFSEANVRLITGHLSENIGLRLIGTESVDETEQYLIREIKELKEQAKIEKATGQKNLPNFDMWIQVNDGSHRFDFMSKGKSELSTLVRCATSMYTNMTNIIVRLSCGPECDKNAILLNAHYDTTLGSPGAADDALGVGVQMELIRILSQQPALKKNSVIFLFNGGEESLQDASHSFITQHELKDTVRAVINLEGCGTSGPEILFQANSRPMIDAYKKVPYPHGSVVANDLFSTGMILSDTDFRQFVDHGNLTGLDMAVYMNSYLYHTHLDLNEHMELGLPQHMGENTLALVRHIGNEVELTTNGGKMFEKTSQVVFFDVMGFFFLAYPFDTAIRIHLLIGSLALYTLSSGASRPSQRSVISILLSFVTALMTPNLVAFILVTIGKPMQWFTHEWLPIAIFSPISAAAMLTVQYFFYDKRLSAPTNELATLSGIQFFFGVVMGSATYAQLASSYITAVYSLPYTLGLIFNQNRIYLLRRLRKTELSATVDFSTYLVSSLVPTAYFFYAAISLFDFLVPLTGRTGVDTPADYIAATLSGLYVFCACPPILAFAHRFGLPTLKRIISLLLILQVMALFVSTMYLEPFDKMHPKRIFAQHLRNLTSGETLVYVAHADAGPIYDNYVRDLETLFDTKARFKSGLENPGDWNAIYPFSQFLDSYILDTTPFIRSETLNDTIATSTAPLTDLIHDAPKLIAEGVSYDPTTGLRRLTVLCTHPEYILTVISFDAQLTSWSLSSDVPSKETFHYVIRNAGGYRTDGWRLDLEYKAKGPEDRLRIEITSMETESFDWRVEKERELAGSGDIGVMRKLVRATPDFIALTYFSTVASLFEL
ncbi:hypothetical protein BGZ80_006200 [Entomortierella chlamydospora]|uniref:Peptide hydrolase n=1 Tax=Entomortierella chlamydospora TaxID=101097 RepID=A0A9P6T223_9FUNG|nr:hypothetical protein BGZ80_006200 [Entomortierella chlamydospora]